MKSRIATINRTCLIFFVVEGMGISRNWNKNRWTSWPGLTSCVLFGSFWFINLFSLNWFIFHMFFLSSSQFLLGVQIVYHFVPVSTRSACFHSIICWKVTSMFFQSFSRFTAHTGTFIIFYPQNCWVFSCFFRSKISFSCFFPCFCLWSPWFFAWERQEMLLGYTEPMPFSCCDGGATREKLDEIKLMKHWRLDDVWYSL